MKLSLFPFTPETEVLSRNIGMMTDHTISSVISFKEDATHLSMFAKGTDIFSTTSIEDAMQRSEALYLLDNIFSFKWDKYHKCIEYAAKNSKPIYASKYLINEIQDEKFKPYIIRSDKIHLVKNEYADRRLFEIETPIVLILGMGENCGKFECQLELKKLLDNLGYHAEWLCSNPLGSLMGMYSLPDFLFDSTRSFPDKVLELNKYVFDLCNTKRPDILVVSAPSGIMPLTDKDTNYFGEIPLIISSALQVDYGILTFYYRLDASDGFLDRISQYVLQRYQINVPIYYMSRQMMEREQEGHRVKHLFLSDAYITKYESDYRASKNVATPLKDNTSVFETLISLLQDNLNTV